MPIAFDDNPVGQLGCGEMRASSFPTASVDSWTQQPYRDYKPLIKRADLADQAFTFHTLPHTFATALFKQDEHPKVIQALLGHFSTTPTIDTYSHLMEDIGGDAVGGLAQRSVAECKSCRYLGVSRLLDVGLLVLPVFFVLLTGLVRPLLFGSRSELEGDDIRVLSNTNLLRWN